MSRMHRPVKRDVDDAGKPYPLFYEYRCRNSDMELYVRVSSKGKVVDGTAIRGKHLIGRTIQDVADWLHVIDSHEPPEVSIERIIR
jgi:hypothetical protein